MGAPEDTQALNPDSVPGVVFADIVGSTALYRALGNERAGRSVESALRTASEVAGQFGGRPIKTIGDCLLALLPDADAAFDFASELQRQFQAGLDAQGVAIRWRIGFACGPVIERDGDIFGDVVNLASRIAEKARPEQVLTHDSTLAWLSPKRRAQTRPYDQVELKGIGKAEGLLQVFWERRGQTEMVVIPAELREAALEIVLDGGGEVRRLGPSALPLSFGRSEACGWPIRSSYASREHLTLEYRRGKFTLVDHSTNGTFVCLASRNYEPAYLRNEAFPLFGEGLFCLGSRPDVAADGSVCAPPEDAPPLIRFRIC